MRLSLIVQAQQVARVNVASTPLEVARDLAESQAEHAGKSLDALLPHFDYGYKLLQNKLHKAKPISRAEMPVIRQVNMPGFSKHLTEQGIHNKMTETPVAALLPTQKQIWLDKAIADPIQHGKLSPGDARLNLIIITSKDGYILDGHHRFTSALLSDPKLKQRTLLVDLPIDKLVPLAKKYGESVGNEARASVASSAGNSTADRESTMKVSSYLRGAVAKRQGYRGDSSYGDPISGGDYHLVAKPPGEKKFLTTTVAAQPSLSAAKKVAEDLHKKDKGEVQWGVYHQGKVVWSTED